MTPEQARFSAGLVTPTAGWRDGSTRASLVAVPREPARDVLLFARRNPEPCPVPGAPVHVGDPRELGTADLDAPDSGDAVRPEPGDVPVFRACGVTPQAAVAESRPACAITHAPGHALVIDAYPLRRRRDSPTPTRHTAPPTSASTGGSSPSSTADMTIVIGGTT